MTLVLIITILIKEYTDLSDNIGIPLLVIVALTYFGVGIRFLIVRKKYLKSMYNEYDK